MALNKQTLNINFSQGVQTKSDPWQVPAGQFLALQNSVFDKGGLLQKRNGFSYLPELSEDATTLCTHNENLIAIGTTLQALSADTNQWFDRGGIQPCSLSVVPTVRSATNQLTVDTAIAPNGLACVAFKDSTDNGYYYQIVDSATGQVIVSRTALPSGSVFARAFTLGSHFIITFLITSGTVHLQYIAIPLNRPDSPTAAANLSTVVANLSAGYDGVVSNNNLYLAYNASDGGGAVRVTYLDSTLDQHNTVVLAGSVANLMSLAADETGSTSVIWVTFYTSSSNRVYTSAFSHTIVNILPATLVATSITSSAITSSAQDGAASIFIQKNSTYNYSPNATNNNIVRYTCNENGSVSSVHLVLDGVSLVSKSVYYPANDIHYMLVAYVGQYQPTYFLIDEDGNVVSKLAYQNATGGVATQVLPQINLTDTLLQIGYLVKDQISSVNKAQGATSVAGVYSQYGINLVNFDLDPERTIVSEIGGSLHLTGGFLWMYDGSKPVENGFHLWPEDIAVTTSTSGGSIAAQQYYYYVTYEWTDAQGNIHRSAPSIPMTITTTGATSTNTIKIPTLRVTYKVAPNPVRICIYRWSVAQQTAYMVTSVSAPTLNDTSVSNITYADTAADSAIIGNAILYTTGGVLENIGAPATDVVTLFNNRLWLLDAEDPNLFWYSKQVIEQTPVEMSDLLTMYIAPTTGAQGSTGPTKAAAALDDKLIMFKKDAIYYINGVGPDNTGGNNQYSEPNFVTAVVGCSNQQSIVFQPNGLMFQSDKGIWLLGRDLSTRYIGDRVEGYTQTATVLSALNIPGTNQVRFTLDSGITLMYDYYYDQWGTFINIPGISSTLYEGVHTFLNSRGNILQETPGHYLDGANPVLLSFKTSWFNLAGLQGYERFYFFYLLGKYYTPHKIQIQLAYDYNPWPSQSVIITPDNYSPPYGDDTLYGSASPYAISTNVEDWRVFPEQQKCEAFQIQFQEYFDGSIGAAAGAGLTLSGLDLVVGVKKGYRTQSAGRSAG